MKKKEIQPDVIWNEEKSADLKDFIIAHSLQQSKEQKLRNELLAIQYKIEDYKCCCCIYCCCWYP